MENLDLIIFSIILVILFILFAIGTLAEFSKMSSTKFKPDEKKGGAAWLAKVLGEFLMK